MVESVDGKVQMTKGSSKPHHETPHYLCPRGGPSARRTQTGTLGCRLSSVLDEGLRWLLFTSGFPYSVLPSSLALHKATHCRPAEGGGAGKIWESRDSQTEGSPEEEREDTWGGRSPIVEIVKLSPGETGRTSKLVRAQTAARTLVIWFVEEASISNSQL